MIAWDEFQVCVMDGPLSGGSTLYTSQPLYASDGKSPMSLENVRFLYSLVRFAFPQHKLPPWDEEFYRVELLTQIHQPSRQARWCVEWFGEENGWNFANQRGKRGYFSS